MNPLLASPSDFSSLLQRFFVERLMQQRNASPRTVASYRDSFRLLLGYMKDHRGKCPSAVTLNDFNAELILEFLDHLESKRRNSIRSRNTRLAALHSFARFVALQCPPALHLCHQILAIPAKLFEKPMLGFLSREEFRAILSAPDARTWCGRRDRILFSLLYNTGARVSELIGIRVADIMLDGTPSVRLHGKGRKQRTVPLWKETATQVRQWIKQESLQPSNTLLPNRQGMPMTRSNVSERLALATAAATTRCPQLKGRRITPHTIRHTTAMHLLQSGVDITVIALWLGHESPVTTHGYVEADLAMKDRALNTVRPPKAKKGRYRPADSLLKFLESL
jgi:site-specific recombinase XerD